MSVVHVAAQTVEAEGVMRQRCAWCGALLIEYELANMARPLDPGEDPENPEPWTPGSWPPGALVRVDDHREARGVTYGSIVEQEPHPSEPETRVVIPDDACLALDRAVTA